MVANGQDTCGSITASVDLCQTRTGALFAARTWFGLAHITALVIASSVVAFPLGFAAVLPTGVVLGGVLLITMLYFAVTDFLHVGRLAAYVAIAEMPEPPAKADKAQPPLLDRGSEVQSATQSRPAVDASELILSDVPAST